MNIQFFLNGDALCKRDWPAVPRKHDRLIFQNMETRDKEYCVLDVMWVELPSGVLRVGVNMCEVAASHEEPTVEEPDA